MPTRVRSRYARRAWRIRRPALLDPLRSTIANTAAIRDCRSTVMTARRRFDTCDHGPVVVCGPQFGKK